MPRDRCAQRLALRRHGPHATRVDGENGRPARHTTHPARVAACAGGQQSRRTRDLVHRTFIPRSESLENGRVIWPPADPQVRAGYWVRLGGCSSRRTRRHTRLIFAARSPRSPPVVWPPIPGRGPPSPGRPPRGRVGRRRACPSAPWEPARRPGLLNARPPRVGRLLAGLSGVWRDPHSRNPVDPCRRARMALLPLQRTRRPTRQHLRLQGRAALRPRVLSVDSTRAEGPRHRATGTTAARWRARGRRQPATLTAAQPGGRAPATGRDPLGRDCSTAASAAAHASHSEPPTNGESRP